MRDRKSKADSKSARTGKQTTNKGKAVRRVRRVYDSSGHYVCASWEQWEMGFTREANLRAEVELWEAIDSAFHSYLGSGSVSPAKAQEVLGYLCIIAGDGPVPDDGLGRKLKRLYNGPIRPVRIALLPGVAVSKVDGDGHWQSLPKVPVEELESMGCLLRTAYLRNLDLIVAHNRDNGA